ncbi:MAG: hypothetical protein Q9208_004489 [Pyrenodesmia sp. 3 TL-2023]
MPPDQSQKNYSLIIRSGEIDKHLEDTIYHFDRVFHESDTNLEVYQHIKPIVQAAIDGLDTTIILDGPSNSGKSYSIFGENGIAASIARHVFQRPILDSEPIREMRIELSAFKVYREKLFDTRDIKSQKELSIMETQPGIFTDSGHSSKVQGQTISSLELLVSQFKEVYEARDKRSTDQNQASSRGHTICMLKFISSRTSTTSRLYLVDLAGPESRDRSAETQETKDIMKGRQALQDRLSDIVRLRRLKPDKQTDARDRMRRELKNSMV